jgi:hypothetical protein
MKKVMDVFFQKLVEAKALFECPIDMDTDFQVMLNGSRFQVHSTYFI